MGHLLPLPPWATEEEQAARDRYYRRLDVMRVVMLSGTAFVLVLMIAVIAPRTDVVRGAQKLPTCQQMYNNARTTLDTARVDHIDPVTSRADAGFNMTCGEMRRAR